MKLKMGQKASIRAQKNYLERRKKATVILAEPQARQWDDVAKKYTDTVTGYKYTFTLDGAGRCSSS